jgi:hypothetical protein
MLFVWVRTTEWVRLVILVTRPNGSAARHRGEMVLVVAGMGPLAFSNSMGVGWSLKLGAGWGRKQRDYWSRAPVTR